MKPFAPSLLILSLALSIFSYSANSQVLAFETWGINDFEFSSTKDSGQSIPRVYMEHEFLEKDFLKITIKIENLTTPLIGAAFHLVYEPEKLEFIKYIPGGFFETGGDPLYLVTQKSPKIIFGETLKKDDTFPVGQGEILDFYFQIKKEKPYSFSFENGVLSGMDLVMQDLREVNWESLEILDSQNAISQTNEPQEGLKSSKFKDIFSFKNILLTLIPGSAVFISLFAYYTIKIKPQHANSFRQF